MNSPAPIHDLAPEPEPPPAAHRPAAPVAEPKSPLVALLLSGLPGAGHLYVGLYMRGLVFFLVVATLIKLASRADELFAFAVVFFWVFNALDAYRQARLMNLGLVQDLGVAESPRQLAAGHTSLAAGVLLVAIGLFALLDRFFYFDLDWVVDFWPVGLMALGGWILFGVWRDRQRRQASELD